MTHKIKLSWLEHLAVFNATGEHVGWVLHDTPDDAPDAVKRGLTARRHSLLHGRCECGAELVWAARGDGTPNPHVAHRPECPGSVEVLGAAIAEWEGR